MTALFRAGPILPTNYEGKKQIAKCQKNWWKFGKMDAEGLELSVPWVAEIKIHCTIKELLQTALDQSMLLGKVLKDQDTLIEQCIFEQNIE